MLSGKPVPVEKVSDEQDNTVKVEDVQEATPGEEKNFYFAGEKTEQDRVSQDIKIAKSIAKDALLKVKQVPIPKSKFMQEGDKFSGGIKKTFGNLQKMNFMANFSNELLGKIIRVVVIISLSAILIFVLFSLYRLFEGRINTGNGGVDVVQNGDAPTPTPVSYRPYEPSIYASDSELLQIEENLSILDAEIFRANIGDSVIRPSSLDFNVRF